MEGHLKSETDRILILEGARQVGKSFIIRKVGERLYKNFIEINFVKATGVKVPYAIAPRREGDIIQVWADPSKANTILGWKAETPLEQTMLNAWHWQQHLRETGVM